MSGSVAGTSPASSILEAISPEAPLDWAHAMLLKHWGLRGVLQPLAGERDRNFLVTILADGSPLRYVFKISHPAEAPVVADFQTRALLHISRADPALPVQRIMPTQVGQNSLLAQAPDGSKRVVRVFSYLPGIPLPKAKRSPAQAQAIARTLAHLDLALHDFHHAAGALKLPWDIQHADDVVGLLDCIGDTSKRTLAQRALYRFLRHVKPRLGELRAQTIHNDFNVSNLLVDPVDHDRIAGILDFGDIVHAPLINDLAVAAAYQVEAGGDTLAALCQFVTAYHAVLPLQPLELELLFDLIQARLLMVVSISGWRAAREPSNAEYLLRNNAVSWTRLAACDAVSRKDASSALRNACGFN